MYRLKNGVADFTVVDGPFERRSYKAGEVYEEKDIPPQEKHKFETVEAVTEEQSAPEPARKKTK